MNKLLPIAAFAVLAAAASGCYSYARAGYVPAYYGTQTAVVYQQQPVVYQTQPAYYYQRPVVYQAPPPRYYYQPTVGYTRPAIYGGMRVYVGP